MRRAVFLLCKYGTRSAVITRTFCSEKILTPSDAAAKKHEEALSILSAQDYLICYHNNNNYYYY